MPRLKYFNTETNQWEYVGANGAHGKDGYTPVKGVDYFDGEPGTDGKSAYAYAQDAGYTGTEEEFAEKLAQGPLVCLSSEIKPSQVYEAIGASRDVVITHIHKTFGLFGFTSFDVNVSLNVMFSSSILQYNGMYAVVELIGYLDTDKWEFIIQQIPILSDIPVPVIGTTAEVTPSQVKSLMDAGKPFAVTHTDNLYGSMLFNSFVYAQAIGTVVISSTVFRAGDITYCAQLIGDYIHENWMFDGFQLAAYSDIPTIPESLKNPYALTINGTTYDGSEAKNISGLATETYVDNKVAAMVDSAPDTLNTLNELAAALGDDPNFATTISTQIGGKVDKVSGKDLSTNDYTDTDKAKLDNTNIAYGTCSTAAETAEKAVVLNGNTQWSLKTGSIIMVKFDISNTASNVTLNVNGTGAYPIWYNNAEYTGTSTAYTGYANRTIAYMFNGTHYVWITASYDTNSTYTNATLGQGYATCSTAAATTAKVGSLSSYKLVTGGIVSVKFTNAVPANATLNINSTGAKSIYFRGAKITADVIKAGDVATFVYSSYYHLISIDRWQNDISTMQTQIESISANIAKPLYVDVANSSEWTLSHTLDEIETAYQNGRSIFLKYRSTNLAAVELILGLEMRSSSTEWKFSNTVGNLYISVYLEDTGNSEMVINKEIPTDSHINSLIDAKLATITNAEEVGF